MIKKLILTLTLALGASSGLAHNKVVVIPMAGDDAVPIKNIVTVGLENADFTNPADAINSITNATEFEPYLVFIEPGTYTLGANELIVKPNVHLVGIGTGATILEGGFGSSDVSQSAVVRLNGIINNRSVLRDLTIIQYGSSSNTSSGIYAAGWSSIDNVEVKVRSSGTSNYGIYTGTAVLEIKDSNIEVNSAPSANIGVRTNGGTNDYSDVDIRVAVGIFTAAIYSSGSRVSLIGLMA